MAQQYTPEEQAAAWAAYYAQQGYDPSQYAQAGGSSSAAGYGGGADYYGGGGGGGGRAAYDPDHALQASAYTPGGFVDSSSSGGGGVAGPSSSAYGYAAGAGYDPSTDPSALASTDGKPPKKEKPKPQGKRETVIRKSGGKVWEDPTLLDWDSSWFRLFVGDLANDMSERTLDQAFGKYASYCKCKVVRDRLSMKAKYGFIAFKDPEDMLKAWKEMDGKYVGNRPIRLMKCQDKMYGGTAKVQVGNRKGKELDKIAKNKGKPLNGRPTPW